MNPRDYDTLQVVVRPSDVQRLLPLRGHWTKMPNGNPMQTVEPDGSVRLFFFGKPGHVRRVANTVAAWPGASVWVQYAWMTEWHAVTPA